MGTNFYKKTEPCPTCGRADEREHIGKRSAAGLYCWDCRVTLCAGGEADVHASRSEWHKSCPRCEKAPQRTVAITGCSSFTWAIEPSEARAFCEANSDRKVIVDEYDCTMTGGAFLKMLRDCCPIEFTDSIGRDFS